MELVVQHLFSPYTNTKLDIYDFGSRIADNERYSYRSLFANQNWTYSGLDIEAGPNVDHVLPLNYNWSSIPSQSADIVISGQTFEHIPYFWISIFEIARMLKKGGVAVIIAPSSGGVHRFPEDCWRFYEDGMSAIGRYADLDVIDVFTDHRNGDWGDTIAIFNKPKWTNEMDANFRFRHHLQMQLVDPAHRLENVIDDTYISSLLGFFAKGTISTVLESKRKKAIGKVFPTKERLRRSSLEILGEFNIDQISKFIKKLKAIRNSQKIGK
jgi:SAM-dependent methyltransferase